jgi:hypothetical protein
MVSLPGRGSRLPAGVTTRMGIDPREKVVSWGSSAAVAGETYVVATDRALYLNEPGERLAWDRITKATWDEPTLELVVAGPPTRRLRLTVDQSRDLPAAVRDRVTASVVVSERLDLGGGQGATAVARRSSEDGSIRWNVVFDRGLDPSDPTLREAADIALANLRESLGI